MDDETDRSYVRDESGEALLVCHLRDIQTVITFVCRRNGLREADAEDFSSEVLLRIIENDYAILRKFESRCAFKNYLVVVVQRLLLDRRNRDFGKWHASAEAKRFGAAGVLAEKLLRRERKTVDETADALARSGMPLTKPQIEELCAQLPERKSRPREVNLAEGDETSAGATAEPDLTRGDRTRFARRLSDAVRKSMSRFSAEDQAIIRMHFDADMTVAEIARALNVSQKPIYRRLQRRLDDIRKSLKVAGIDAPTALEVVSDAGIELELGLDLDRQKVPADSTGSFDGDVS
jgi:RNA polymerase sigma factor for flagellar operon FliA